MQLSTSQSLFVVLLFLSLICELSTFSSLLVGAGEFAARLNVQLVPQEIAVKVDGFKGN